MTLTMAQLSPSGDVLSQLGIGGVIAYLLIKEVLGFLRKREMKSDSHAAGDQPVPFWQMEFRKAVGETIGPMMEKQTELLERMTAVQEHFDGNLTILNQNIAIMMDRDQRKARGNAAGSSQ